MLQLANFRWNVLAFRRCSCTSWGHGDGKEDHVYSVSFFFLVGFVFRNPILLVAVGVLFLAIAVWLLRVAYDGFQDPELAHRCLPH